MLKYVLAKLHQLLFWTKFRLRSRTWVQAHLNAQPKSGTVIVSGFFEEALGTGRAAELTVEALRSRGHDVIAHHLRPLQRKLLTRSPDPFILAPQASIWLIHANPPEAMMALFVHDERKWRPLYRIGYWAWESSLAPKSWARAARWFHEIWVPSEFVRQALISCFEMAGKPEETHKLRVMPHLVMRSTREPHSEQGFQAVTLFDARSSYERKNPLGSIDAWILAFPIPSEGLNLLIKTMSGEEKSTPFKWLVERAGGRPDIQFLTDTLSNAQTRALIGKSNVLLSLHRGEGFGLTIAEAMVDGVCVVATGWSGNMEYMTGLNSFPVPFKLQQSPRRYGGPKARWADPDIFLASQILRQVSESVELRQRISGAAISVADVLRSRWDNCLPMSAENDFKNA